MKRTIPLLITATVGFVMIVAYFIPMMQWVGEFAAISFDILAAIAFILGGGNLLKSHLKKLSDRAAGWGYSGVTILAFLLMLGIGLGKVGAPPAVNQQYYGETFATLALSEFPESQLTRIRGALPVKADGGLPAPSVRRQISAVGDELVFRGWMQANQKADLAAFQDELEWQCTVEKLYAQAQPPESLQGKVAYYADLGMLSFRGVMRDEDKQALLELSERESWREAVEVISGQSRKTTRIPLEELPEGIAIPTSLTEVVSFDAKSRTLQVVGPLTVRQRDALINQFSIAKPLNAEQRESLLREIESRGPALTEAQTKILESSLRPHWSPKQLHAALDAAGRLRLVDKTACEMLAEKEAGVAEILPHKEVGSDAKLNDEQGALLQRFADDPELTAEQLVEQLAERGMLTDAQRGALATFVGGIPTVGDRSRGLGTELLRAGPLSQQQRDFLFTEARNEIVWRNTGYRLFHGAHTVKYSWSGDHGTQGSGFWWMYEYVFKPLTATMFSMLAFYVASAAFRAFRAKNLEAVLLLGTAFIVLLGRTFAGVWMTSWLPEALKGLRIEELTVFIMSVFTTAGNRAIMIGIALGIASTALRVLLGIDRSYLGQQED